MRYLIASEDNEYGTFIKEFNDGTKLYEKIEAYPPKEIDRLFHMWDNVLIAELERELSENRANISINRDNNLFEYWSDEPKKWGYENDYEYCKVFFKIAPVGTVQTYVRPDGDIKVDYLWSDLLDNKSSECGLNFYVAGTKL